MSITGMMGNSESQTKFLESLTAFTKEHRARHWEGIFAAFLEDVLPQALQNLIRNPSIRLGHAAL